MLQSADKSLARVHLSASNTIPLLQDCMDSAIAYNPSIEAAKAAIDKAKAEVLAPIASIGPNLRYTYSQTQSNNILTVENERIPRHPFNSSQSLSINLTVDTSTLFTFLLNLNLKNSEILRQQILENQLSLDVTRSYISITRIIYQILNFQALIRILNDLKTEISLSKSIKNSDSLPLVLSSLSTEIATLNSQTESARLELYNQTQTLRALTQNHSITFELFNDMNTESLKAMVDDIQNNLRIPENYTQALDVAKNSLNLELSNQNIEIADTAGWLQLFSRGINAQANVGFQLFGQSQNSASFGSPAFSSQTLDGISASVVVNINPGQAYLSAKSRQPSIAKANAEFNSAFNDLDKQLRILYGENNDHQGLSTLSSLIKNIKALILNYNESMKKIATQKTQTKNKANSIEDVSAKVLLLTQLRNTVIEIASVSASIFTVQANYLNLVGKLNSMGENDPSIFSLDPSKELDSLIHITP